MSRNTVSIVLSIIFWAFLTAPSALFMIDDSIDISILYESSEEEEKGNESIKDIELLFSELNGNKTNFISTEIENNLGYSTKNYPKPHLNLVSPPPEIL
jgi:hypothetical protein